MEIQFQSEPSKRKKGSRSSTRMYAPTHGEKKRAVAFAPLEREKVSEDAGAAPLAAEAKRTKTVSKIKPFTRFMLVVCSFIFAGMILFVLTGYERISRAYADINTLNEQIEETELNINALNAAIECAVTITQAQEWAKGHNMQYPSQSQYVRAGSSIPVSGIDPATAADPNATGDPAASPDPNAANAQAPTGDAPAVAPEPDAGDAATPDAG